MKSELGDKSRLQHILDAIQEIQKYVMATELPSFQENSMMRFALSNKWKSLAKQAIIY